MPASRTPFDRSAALEALRTSSFDVVVIGGGITGAGVALDAAARGLRVALVEREDLASGTSGHSSKLVHGGLRYLQKGELGLVVESLAERQRLLDNAAHLVTPLAFVIPLLGTKGKLDAAVTHAFTSVLRSYDLAGGRRIGQRHRSIDAAEVSSHLGFLRTERLMAGLIYWDARTDDARLTLAVARTAAERGAVVATYVSVTELLADRRGQVAGVRLAVDGSATPIEVAARVVVNATGVWADQVEALVPERAQDRPEAAEPVALSPVASVLASGNQPVSSGAVGHGSESSRGAIRVGELARRAALGGDIGLSGMARRAGLAAMTAGAKVATSTGLAARAGLAAEPNRPGRGGMGGLAALARRTGADQWLSPRGVGGNRPTAENSAPSGAAPKKTAPASPLRTSRPSFTGRLLKTVATGLTSPSSGSASAGAPTGTRRDPPPAAEVGPATQPGAGGGPGEAEAGARRSGRTRLRPAKGIHITVPASRLPCDMAAVLPGPGDKRSIFVVPWGAQVYVGTTDTDYRGSLDEPRATVDDVDYLLRALNASISEPLSAQDITGVWAGLRPLLADTDTASARTADLSRHHRVIVSSEGLVTVTGGKLTTYRRMASDTVDVVVRRLNPGQLSRRMRRSPTTSLHLWGSTGLAQLRDPGAAQRLGTDPGTLEHLVSRYGGEAPAVLALVKTDPGLGRPMVEGLPFLAAEAIYAARHEMAHTLTDILVRRTNALYRDRLATVEAAPEVAALVAPELGWDGTEARRQVAQVLAAAARDGEAAGLPRPARL